MGIVLSKYYGICKHEADNEIIELCEWLQLKNQN
jgi:hypothetical protein